MTDQLAFYADCSAIACVLTIIFIWISINLDPEDKWTRLDALNLIFWMTLFGPLGLTVIVIGLIILYFLKGPDTSWWNSDL